MKDSVVTVRGNNNKIVFSGNNSISGLRILITGNNNLIKFGKDVTVNASSVQPTVINAVDGSTIKIENGSLISNNVEIHTTDYHGIYDFDGNRVNLDKDISIGKHVWISLGVKILKGTNIASGCVVGAGSLLSKKYEDENSIIAGNPAKVIKKNIFWANERKTHYVVPNYIKKNS